MKALLVALLLSSFFCQAEEKVKNERQVSIRAVHKTDRNDAQRQRTEVTRNYLEINLRGSSDITGAVEVVSIIFAKKLPKGGDTQHRSTRKVKLDKQHLASFRSTTQKLTHTNEHEVRVTNKKKNNNRRSNNGRNNNNKQVRFKTVPASGQKPNGWAVRVYQDGKLLGEAASATQYKLDP